MNIIGTNDVDITASTADILLSAATYVKIDETLLMPHRNTDPAYPADGESILWVSDGTKTGDAGDFFIAASVSGTVRYQKVMDYSACGVWTRVA